jgi:hypothetical protein
VSDGGYHESLICVGEMAVAVNPAGAFVAAGFIDELEEGLPVPFEFIADTW